jgi:hypothetical protein
VKKLIALFVLAAVLVTSAVGCGSATTSAAKPATPPAKTP